MNVVGAYSGTTVWGFGSHAETAAVLQVDSDDPYSLTFSPLSSTPAFAVPAEGVVPLTNGPVLVIVRGDGTLWKISS